MLNAPLLSFPVAPKRALLTSSSANAAPLSTVQDGLKPASLMEKGWAEFNEGLEGGDKLFDMFAPDPKRTFGLLTPQ